MARTLDKTQQATLKLLLNQSKTVATCAANTLRLIDAADRSMQELNQQAHEATLRN